MIIDGHAHSCGEFCKIEETIKLLNELKVDKIVLCPGINNDQIKYSIPCLAKIFKSIDLARFTNIIIKLVSKMGMGLENMEEKNQYVYKLHKKFPDRVIQFYWIDLNKENLIKDLNNKHDLWEFKGLKLHQCFQNFDINSQKIEEIIAFAEEKHIPIFIHFYSKKEIKQFINLAEKYEKNKFIVAHLIGMEIFNKHLKKLDNIYFDISCSPLISEKRIYRAIKAFGAEKILFGSDTPFGKNNLRKNIEKINNLNISNEEKKLIFGENIQNILDIRINKI